MAMTTPSGQLCVPHLLLGLGSSLVANALLASSCAAQTDCRPSTFHCLCLLHEFAVLGLCKPTPATQKLNVCVVAASARVYARGNLGPDVL